MPTFSIIIPVSNGASYLRECLESVRNQDFISWECLCVDDGSCDETPIILAKYMARDKRFRIITNKERKGVSTSRNIALGMAVGEYVSFLDADDAITENWLGYAYEIIRAKDPDLVRLQYLPWADGQKRPIARDDGGNETWDGINDVVAWGWRTFLCGGHSWLLFIHRQALGNVRFPEDLAVREDVVFDMDAILHMRRVCSSGYRGYFYRMRNDSAWHRSRRLEDAVNFPLACRRIYLEQFGLVEKSGDKIEAAAVCYVRAILNNLQEWVMMADREARRHDCKVIDSTGMALSLMGQDAFKYAGRWSYVLRYTMYRKSLTIISCAMHFFRCKAMVGSFLKRKLALIRGRIR